MLGKSEWIATFRFSSIFVGDDSPSFYFGEVVDRILFFGDKSHG